MVEVMKKCPFCAETIKAEAVVCRYCGKELISQKRKHPEIGLLGLVLIVVGLIWTFAAISAWGFVVLLLGAVILVYALITGNVKMLG